MKASLKQEIFAKALGAAGRVATNKAGLPVLNNILLRTDGSRLLVASTNLELASTHYVNAKIINEGQITIPARLASEFVSNLPKKNVEIVNEDNKLTITCEGFVSTLNGIDASDFPELPTIDEEESIQYSIRVDDFKSAVSQTAFACSNDAARPVLTGVYWHSYEGSLYLVGTDGYRLAERRLMTTESDLAAIVPTTTLNEVLRVISDDVEMIEVLFDETQVRFRIGDAEVTSRLIDGKYPDYRKLIPTQTTTHMEVAKADMMRTTKIAALFARNSGGSVTFDADGDQNTFSIASIASEVGENNSRIETSIEGGGTLTLNSRYVLEVLNVIHEDTISVGFNGKLAPCLVKPVGKTCDYQHVIMPLKS